MKSAGTSEAWVRRWDLPARMSHWGFALSLGTSLWIGFRCDPESQIFQIHYLAALWAVWFLGMRVVLGFRGSRPMRWRLFWHSPVALWRYLLGVWEWRRMEFDGVNPGTSFFASAIYGALGMLIWSGFEGSWGEVWHGRIAVWVLGLMGSHLLGLSLNALRHGAKAWGTMVHGWEAKVASEVPGQRNESTEKVPLNGLSAMIWGLVSAGVIGAALWYFDWATGTLAVPGLPELSFPLIQKG